jgi:capsular exopolysaccharide synthesis family protein
MSKMYEALQQVKEEKPALQGPKLVKAASDTSLVPLNLKTEMLNLYRALDNSFTDLHQRVILFIGAKGGEGTSTMVYNLAQVVAERFQRTVAVLDADTLHPTQHRFFNVNPAVGWDDVLKGTEPAEKAFYQTNENQLWVVPVSSASAGTFPVIDATSIENFFGVLRKRFDLVLIDCAPTAVFPDSIALSRKADGVVLVIEAESTRCPVAETVRQQITKAGGKMIGTVFNKRRYYIPGFVYRRL